MKYIVNINNTKYEVEVEEGEARIVSETAMTAAPAKTPAAAPATPAAPAATAAPADGTPVTAPMPGTVLAVKVQDGQNVNAGDTVLVLEAMKMENDIVAPAAGKVKLMTEKGSTVDTGAVLAVIV